MKKCFVMLVGLAFLVSSCDDEKNAKIQVWLTDAPADYQEVNVDITGVEIHSSETDNGTGWTALNVTAGVYNLRELANGMEMLLGESEIPGGKISQIRLKLGENNTVKVSDEVFPLNTPSSQQSGLKLQLHQVLAEGITYKILLDFDAARSVLQTGNGAYSLRPVIRASTSAEDGAIKGMVTPAGTPVTISAILDNETVTTTSVDDNGNFMLKGLAAGTYKIVFDAGTDFQTAEKTDVVVELGATTDLGTIALTE
jgi:hypothetical protein